MKPPSPISMPAASTRRSIVTRSVAGAVAAAGAALAAPAIYAQPAVRWRLASSFPKSLDTLFGACNVFSGHVRVLSGGKFEISTHQAGELVPAFSVVDAVQQGSIEACNTAPYYFYGKDPTFALGAAIPFGLNARQMTAWMMHGNGRKLMNEFYAKYDMLSFSGGNTGAQMGGWYRKEIRTVEDFKGMKIRLGGGLVGEVFARMGAVPQSIPAADIYPALEKGTIDAAEGVGPHDDHRLGWYKIAPYYYYPGWWEGSTQIDFYVNRKAYDALSVENKAIIDVASKATHVDMLAKYDALNPVALRQLVAQKVKVLQFPQATLETAYSAALEIFEQNNARSADWKKIYADLKNFQREQVMWFRFTEGTFDRFVQSRKL